MEAVNVFLVAEGVHGAFASTPCCWVGVKSSGSSVVNYLRPQTGSGLSTLEAHGFIDLKVRDS